MNHFNHKYTGGIPNEPYDMGDRFFSYDLSRDHYYLLSKQGELSKDLYTILPLIINGLVVSKGTGNTLNITDGVGYASRDITVTAYPWTVPPSTTTDTIIIRVSATAMTDMALPSAIFDDATINYIKLRFNEVDIDTRVRELAAGSYAYLVSDSFQYIVSPATPTTYDIVLGSFISVGGNVPTTFDLTTRTDDISSIRELEIRNYAIKLESLTSSNVLKVNKQYIITNSSISSQLPSSANVGDTIEIFSKIKSVITQSDAENIIVYQNRRNTTKGTLGYLDIPNNSVVRLTYTGIDGYNNLPGLKLTDPASIPTSAGYGLGFSYDSIYLAITLLNSPYLIIYKRSGDTFTKLTDPGTLPTGLGNGATFSYDGTYLAVGHNTTPFITIYKRSGDTFTKLANPATLPTGIGYETAFSYDGTYLAVAHGGSPNVTIYKRSGDTFTKLANPATLPTSTGYGVSFSYDGTYLAVAHLTSPFITIYKRSGDTFTKLANPATLPTGDGLGAAFSYDGTYLAVAHSVTPFITIYKRSGDTFTKLADPGTLPTAGGRSLRFSFDNNFLAITHYTTPFITIYKRSGDTFTKLANPATLPTGTGNGVGFTLDTNYLAISFETPSPYFYIYKNFNQTNKTWEIINVTVPNETDFDAMFK